MKRQTLALCLGLMMPLLARAQALPAPATSAGERITIDGSKNPEMVPQWAAWRFAFTQIREAKDIPSDVIRLISKAEGALILKDADADEVFYKDGETRALKLQQQLFAEPDRAKQLALAPVLQAKADEIEMECRQHTLDLRDHLLGTLRSEGRAALIAFVEAGKAGHRVTLLKSRLAAYRRPE
jgi:hypothetical protein